MKDSILLQMIWWWSSSKSSCNKQIIWNYIVFPVIY